ncbi:MAG: cyclic nucleotide-binding domain-containing protein [Ignavibacteria bacterium]|nr:cyclic nucleotide-binding domain-containing protein [Ignavibacteria bacterium]MCC7158004.1 cyclic nucleotide-binding domain-containing protein [Ignavibacteria bacterium]
MFRKSSTEGDLLKKRVTECPVFSGISSGELKALLTIAHIRDYSEGEKVFEDGTIGLCFYIIETGSIRMVSELDGSIKTMRELTAGECFSEIHLFSELRHSLTCVAAEVSRLIVFAKPDFEELVKINPKLGNKILLRFLKLFGESLQELYRENKMLKHRITP